MSEWASHSDELSRKVLTVLESRVHECVVDGKYDETTLRLIVDSLYDTVSGLVPWDCLDVINTISKELLR
jgi:hypothetical protein